MEMMRRLQHHRVKIMVDLQVRFSHSEINLTFGVKDPIPNGLCLCVVYKFLCPGYNACYIGETTRHFSTLVCEHLVTDRAFHVFQIPARF